jgi:hypothetical protein
MGIDSTRFKPEVDRTLATNRRFQKGQGIEPDSDPVNKLRKSFRQDVAIVEIDNPALAEIASNQRKAAKAGRAASRAAQGRSAEARRQRFGVRQSILGADRTSRKTTLGGF